MAHEAIDGIIFGTSRDEKQIITDIFFILMKELNQTYSEILEMPIPLADAIIARLNKLRKEEEKQMKNAR